MSPGRVVSSGKVLLNGIVVPAAPGETVHIQLFQDGMWNTTSSRTLDRHGA